MKKIIALASLLTLFGNGCLAEKIPFAPRRAEEQITPASFCARQREDAERTIASFTLSEEVRPFFEIWKTTYMKTNQIDERYFKDHIFLVETRKRDTAYGENLEQAMQYDFKYFVKLNDIYLPNYSGNDYVYVVKSRLNDFMKEQAGKNLEKTIPTALPSADSGERSIYRFTWGGAEASILRWFGRSLPEVMNCEAAVRALYTCHQDIVPYRIVYKPSQDRMTLSGGSPSSKPESDNDCASAAVDLKTTELQHCLTNISCSRSFGAD